MNHIALWRATLLIGVLVFPGGLSDIHSQYSVGFSNTYGGSLEDDGCAVAVNEEFVAVGGRSFSDDGFLHQNQGGTDFWIMQMDRDGDTLWSRTYGGSNNDDVHALEFTSTGGMAAFGTTYSDNGDVTNNPGVVGAWLLVTDPLGNILQSRVYAGILGEQGIDMELLSGGGYALLVQSTSPFLEGAENHGNFDIWVARTDQFGAVIWAKFYGGEEAEIPGRILRIQGGFIFVGSTSSTDGDITQNSGGFDYWVVRLDSDGNIVWQETFGGSGDDHAHDIVENDDGTFLIIGESESQDGDRSQFYGQNDIWIVKIDGSGNLLWERSYGGSADDRGTTVTSAASVTSEYVITAQTESLDGTLSGNKGDQDVWIAFLDDQGNVEQEMNYGGEEDDFGNGLAISQDGELYLCGSSESQDGNLPAQSFGLEDLWLTRLQTDTTACTTNGDCFVIDIGLAILRPIANGPIVCTNGCNVGTSTGPAGPAGCENFPGASTWFKVRTDSVAEFMSVHVASAEFNNPQVLVLQALNCQFFEVLECGFGENGSLSISNLQVDPDTAYYVVIGDAQNRTGEFSLCVSVMDVDFCNQNPELYVNQTSMGSPVEGPFLPGEEVQFCYEITMWDKLECNGLQGIQPEFGPGWDESSFNQSGMPDVDTMLIPHANGTWEWLPLGSVNYNFNNFSQGYQGGDGLPGGWYFTNLDDPPPNEGPNQTNGDITTCMPDDQEWKICFTLVTRMECDTNVDCSVSVKSFADGEIGSIVNQACENDPPTTFNSFLNCCLDPFIFAIPNLTICSGDTITIPLNSTLDPPVSYSYEVIDLNGNIVGAESGSGPLLSQQLFNLGNLMGSVDYLVIGETEFCTTQPEVFTVNVMPQPTARMTLQSPDTICAGDDVIIRFEFIGQPPYVAGLSENGVLQELFLFDEEIAFITLQPKVTTLYNMVQYDDANCPGDVNGTFNVIVRPASEVTVEDQLCPGDVYLVGDQEFVAAGSYTVTLEDAAANGCDSIVNLELSVFPDKKVEIDAGICQGDTFIVGSQLYVESGTYSDTLVAANGCDSIVTLNLTVDSEIFDMRSEIACPGAQIEFRGQILTEGGTYYDTVQITETCDSIYVLSLTIPPNIILIQTEIELDSGENQGAIDIQVLGGFPPYTYLWSTGDTTRTIEDLSAGEYMLTVTDFIGCQQVFDFVVLSSTFDLIPGVSDLKIYPNPVASNGLMHVYLYNTRPDLRRLTMQVLDPAGKLLHEENLHLKVGANTYTLDPVAGSGTRLLYFVAPQQNSSMVRQVVVE